MPNTLTRQDEEECGPMLWLSDDIVFDIFTHLSCYNLLKASQVCKHWHRVSCDQFLWQHLFYTDFNIDRSIPMAPNHVSWKEEYKRLSYETPSVESEVLSDHRDQVLHVCFSHDGKLFSTTSKDGFVKVWNSSYPATVKYFADMRDFTWKYTQYSQFNEDDTLLLVSGVHFGSHSTSGEIAVFSLIGGFTFQSRVQNKPYDIFGTWYNSSSLLSGNLHWRGHLTSCSVLWLNKASQELQSEHDAVVLRLFKFLNVNASSIRTIMVSKCITDDKECGGNGDKKERSCNAAKSALTVKTDERQKTEGVWNSTITYSDDYRMAEVCEEKAEMAVCQEKKPEPSRTEPDKYLIFTTGRKTYTPHQIGIKRIRHQDTSVLTETPITAQRINVPHQNTIGFGGANINQQNADVQEMNIDGVAVNADVGAHHGDVVAHNADAGPHNADAGAHNADAGAQNAHGGDQHSLEDAAIEFDDLDHVIELDGHIIGMCLSPDQRYLYVNSRTWPQGYHIDDPLYPPPIAQEIDIHVIDLVSMQEVGTMHRAHKAYTPNDECFFIFLDVCDEYVASGAEDHHGYLWDRHYGVCLCQYPHTDVVNCVAFNPTDPECLLTVSDDRLLKVWRSRKRMRQLREEGHLPP